MKTVVHIPARSGSTRLKDKNIRNLAGLPLMAYTILISTGLRGVDRVIVNTDSAEYAEIARHYGAETPFLRPVDISGTKARLEDAYTCLMHHLAMQNYHPECVITMYPTSPFRNLHNIQNMVNDFEMYSFVCTGVNFSMDWHKTGFVGSKGFEFVDSHIRGDVPELSYIKTSGHFYGWVLPPFYKFDLMKYNYITDPVELIDIDDIGHFELAEEIITSGVYDFGVAELDNRR